MSTRQGRHFFKLADDLDSMPGQGRRIDLEGVFHQAGQGHFLDDPGNAGIALLHGHDVFDVINVFCQLLQLRARGFPALSEVARRFEK